MIILVLPSVVQVVKSEAYATCLDSCLTCNLLQALIKTKLLSPLLSILLSLMSLSDDEDSDMDDSSKLNVECDDEIDGSTLPSVAAQV